MLTGYREGSGERAPLRSPDAESSQAHALSSPAHARPLYRFVGDTQLNPRIDMVNDLQYDSVSDALGWQARFRWIVRPGGDLYLVYQLEDLMRNTLACALAGA